MRSIGIDIGTYSIKVAEVDMATKTGGVHVRDFYEIPLNLDPQHDARIEKLEALKQIASRYNPQAYKIVVGLGSEYISQRILTFPFTERRKILSSLPFELEDAIPFSQKDAIFDFKVLGNTGAHSTKVLALAVPKKYVKAQLDLCLDAGLDPEVISVDGTALSNLFESYLNQPSLLLHEDETSQASLIVHMGYTKSIIMVLVQGSLLVTRTVLFGGRDLAQAIQRSYQLPYHEALKAVAEKGFILTSKEGASGDQVAFSDAIAKALTPLVGELQRTVAEVKADYKLAFEKGWLMGGMSGLLNLGAYLTQQLEIPMNVMDYIKRVEQLDVAHTPQLEKGSSCAIGLAIEGLRRPRNPAINLRKSEFSKQGQNFQLFWENNKQIFISAMLAYFLIFAYSWIRSDLISSATYKADTATRNILKTPSLAGATATKGGVKTFIKEKQNEIQGRQDVLRYNKLSSPLDLVKRLSQSAPQKGMINLDLRSFSLNDDQLNLDGQANSKIEVDQLVRTWKNLDFVTKFSEVTPRINADPGKVAFSFNLNIRRLPAVNSKGGGG